MNPGVSGEMRDCADSGVVEPPSTVLCLIDGVDTEFTCTPCDLRGEDKSAMRALAGATCADKVGKTTSPSEDLFRRSDRSSIQQQKKSLYLPSSSSL